MNSIVISGRIAGRDGAKKDVAGTSVVSFSVGDSRKIKGEWQTTFFDVDMWGSRGDAILPMLTKGANVVVAGELQTPVVKGEKVYLRVRAHDIQIVREKAEATVEVMPF